MDVYREFMESCGLALSNNSQVLDTQCWNTKGAPALHGTDVTRPQ
jgi:hypothetical protein